MPAPKYTALEKLAPGETILVTGRAITSLSRSIALKARKTGFIFRSYTTTKGVRIMRMR